MKLPVKIILVLVLISIPLFILLINKLYSIYYDRVYKDINLGLETKFYTIKKINVNGNFIFHFGEEGKCFASGGEDLYGSYLYFDTSGLNFRLVTNRYVPSTVEGMSGSEVKVYYTLDQNGNVTESTDLSSDNDRIANGFNECKLIKDDFLTYQKWQDKTKTIYLKHFSKNKFVWESLNPLGGIGNPTGGQTCPSWEGFGYYDLKLKDETVSFKAPCENGSLLLSNDYDYSTGLHYYKLPEHIKNVEDISFLVYVKNFEVHSLYFIKRK